MHDWLHSLDQHWCQWESQLHWRQIQKLQAKQTWSLQCHVSCSVCISSNSCRLHILLSFCFPFLSVPLPIPAPSVYKWETYTCTGIYKHHVCVILELLTRYSWHWSTVCWLTDVAAPSGKDITVRVVEADPIGFHLDFTPLEVGPHTLRIIYGGQCPVVEPLTLMAYDASSIKVMGVKDGMVDCRPSKFTGMSFLH